MAHDALGEVTSFPLDTPIVRLGRLAVAPDGAAWFAEPIGRSISRLKDGKLTRHAFQFPLGGPYGVAVAADGAVWATLQSANQLLRIGPDGTIKALNLPRPAAVPTDIAVGPDGAVWFLQFRGNSIGRLKGGEFVEFAVAKENAGLAELTVSDDGAVWFGMLRARSLGRLRDGEVKTFKLPREDARPYSVAVDRDGNVWYADIRGYVGMLPPATLGSRGSARQGRQLIGGLRVSTMPMPRNRSVVAICRLPHRAPTSGHDVEPPVGTGVPEFGAGQPAFHDPHHPSPRRPARGPDRRPSCRPCTGSACVPWRIRYSPLIHQMICYSKPIEISRREGSTTVPLPPPRHPVGTFFFCS